MDELTPGDIISAVTAAAGAMRGSTTDGWNTKARDLDWTCRRTLNHSIDAVLWYATNLATRSTEGVGNVRDGKKDETPVPELLHALAEQNFNGASPEVQAELLEFFGHPDAPYATKQKPKDWARVQVELERLRKAAPAVVTRESESTRQ